MSRPAVALLLLLAALPVGAGEPDPPLAECARRNLPERSSLQSIELIARDRVGSERSLRAKVWWKRFADGHPRVLARFSEPEDIEGAAVLLVGKPERNDLFLYVPAARKVRRISSQMMKGTLFGTDFSYEDVERLHGMRAEARVSRLPDAELEGVPVRVVEARPPEGAESAYERSVSFVDAETCVPLKVELYEAGDRLRKVLVADRSRIQREGDLWLPRELVMRDLRDDTQTTLRVHELELDAEIPDRIFSTSALERGRTD